jgi:hypothetical protein
VKADHTAAAGDKMHEEVMKIAPTVVAMTLAIAAWSVESSRAQAPEATAAPISAHYAESAALVGWSADGSEEVSVRLARSPARGVGTLWLSIFEGAWSYSVALDPVTLGDERGRTAVEDGDATFAVGGPASPTSGQAPAGKARFACRARHSAAMACTIEAEAVAHRTPHPPLGAGTFPVRLEATFIASHLGVSARPGRLEVFGRVDATIETPQGVRRLAVPGKWHEQTGERPRFAGAFTYFSVTGRGGSLLALNVAGGTAGFALLDGHTVPVRTFSIDEAGSPRRRFAVTLEDGRTIDGETTVVRETSVPIEGRRRPGATVLARTSAGEMVGHLNDWKPEEP